MKDAAPQVPADEEPADDPLSIVRGKQRLLRLLKRPADAARAKGRQNVGLFVSITSSQERAS